MIKQIDQKSLDDLVENSTLLEHQIAGHHGSKNSYVLLNCDDGTLLKPIQLPPKGQREVDFYEMMDQVTEQSNTDLWHLKQFLPTYHGLVKSASSKTTSVDEFLRLANVLTPFHKPCVIDIKIGRVTYDPYATPDKIAREISKYPPLTRVGFIILGMKLFEPTCGEYVFYDHLYGRSLSEEQILLDGVGKFFGWPDRPLRDTVTAILTQLRRLLACFCQQTQLAFYASSLLIAYEGEQRRCADNEGNIVNDTCTKGNHGSNTGNEGICHSHMGNIYNSGDISNVSHADSNTIPSNSGSEGNKWDLPQLGNLMPLTDSGSNDCGDIVAVGDIPIVKMIDFTHVYPTSTVDDNYIYGLRNLISYLERLLQIP